MTSVRLVADVGGTNTRIGLAYNGDLRADSVRSYRNDDFTCFDAVVCAYMAETASPQIAEIVVAVAGPVSHGRARLTNRDWAFSTAGLSNRFDNVPTALLNDLSALGYASGHLGADCIDCVLPPGDTPPEEPRQSLIVGIGTGFNLSPVAGTGEKAQCLKVEAGHVHLPLEIAERLADRFGPAASPFRTVEQVFSGRGYAAIADLFMGEDAAAGSDHPRDIAFQSFYAELVAVLARDLMLSYLPTSGIFFAGGVARNLLSTPARTDFIRVFGQPFDLDQNISAPVYAILDDAAALKGCSNYPL